MNPFGEVLLKLLEDRGMSVADLAERISQMPEAPEMGEDDLLAVMTAEPGEEFLRLMSALDAAFLYENCADPRTGPDCPLGVSWPFSPVDSVGPFQTHVVFLFRLFRLCGTLLLP
jgi:hypothetical protein